MTDVPYYLSSQKSAKMAQKDFYLLHNLINHWKVVKPVGFTFTSLCNAFYPFKDERLQTRFFKMARCSSF